MKECIDTALIDYVVLNNKRSKDHTPRAPEGVLDSNGIGRRGFIQHYTSDQHHRKRVAKIRLRLVGVASFY